MGKDGLARTGGPGWAMTSAEDSVTLCSNACYPRAYGFIGKVWQEVEMTATWDKRHVSWLVMAAVMLVALTQLFLALQAPTVRASCLPHVWYGDETKTDSITGGGTATAKAQIRAFGYLIPPTYEYTSYCTHSEANSNTTVTADSISWSGTFYYNTGGSSTYIDSGNSYCTNCTGGYWASQAFWLLSGAGFETESYGAHAFSKGTWSWYPSTQHFRSYWPELS